MDVTGLRAAMERLAYPPEQRIRLRLDEVATEARARLDAANRAPEEPAVLRSARDAHAKANKASEAGFWKHTEAVKQRDRLAGSEPKGLVAIISLARLRWRKSLDDAEHQVERAKASWNEASEQRETAAASVKRLEKLFEPERRAEEERKRQEAARAKLDLAIIREANALLKERPDLARNGLADVLERARGRLEEQERQWLAREAAERRRHVPDEDRPQAPRFRWGIIPPDPDFGLYGLLIRSVC